MYALKDPVGDRYLRMAKQSAQMAFEAAAAAEAAADAEPSDDVAVTALHRKEAQEARQRVKQACDEAIELHDKALRILAEHEEVLVGAAELRAAGVGPRGRPDLLS